MAAKRIAQSSIDWTRFAQLIPKSERQMFNAFKAKSDAYLRRSLSFIYLFIEYIDNYIKFY
jgi:F-type H+-transporting ATPase subunit d